MEPFLFGLTAAFAILFWIINATHQRWRTSRLHRSLRSAAKAGDAAAILRIARESFLIPCEENQLKLGGVKGIRLVLSLQKAAGKVAFDCFPVRGSSSLKHTRLAEILDEQARIAFNEDYFPYTHGQPPKAAKERFLALEREKQHIIKQWSLLAYGLEGTESLSGQGVKMRSTEELVRVRAEQEVAWAFLEIERRIKSAARNNLFFSLCMYGGGAVALCASIFFPFLGLPIWAKSFLFIGLWGVGPFIFERISGKRISKLTNLDRDRTEFDRRLPLGSPARAQFVREVLRRGRDAGDVLAFFQYTDWLNPDASTRPATD